jgi:hypothetical protein
MLPIETLNITGKAPKRICQKRWLTMEALQFYSYDFEIIQKPFSFV